MCNSERSESIATELKTNKSSVKPFGHGFLKTVKQVITQLNIGHKRFSHENSLKRKKQPQGDIICQINLTERKHLRRNERSTNSYYAKHQFRF